MKNLSREVLLREIGEKMTEILFARKQKTALFTTVSLVMHNVPQGILGMYDQHHADLDVMHYRKSECSPLQMVCLIGAQITFPSDV